MLVDPPVARCYLRSGTQRNVLRYFLISRGCISSISLAALERGHNLLKNLPYHNL